VLFLLSENAHPSRGEKTKRKGVHVFEMVPQIWGAVKTKQNKAGKKN